MKKMILFLIITGVLQWHSVVAQEIDSTLAVSGNVQVLRLQKSYTIGDGLVLRSSVGRVTLNQSLQTLYLINSSNNFNTTNSGFSINRSRLTMKGNLFDRKITMIMRANFANNYQSSTSGSRAFNSELDEALIQYSANPKHTFNIGLRADYIDSRELRVEGEDLSFIGRSAASQAFDAIFDYGIRYVGKYNINTNQLLKTYLSITTGEGRASLQKNYGGLKYGIRLDYYPLGEFSHGGDAQMEDLERETKPKLVVGGVCSYNDGASSAFGTNGGRFLYGDANGKVLLPSYTKYIFDFMFKFRGFYSLGSVMATTATVPTNITGAYSLAGKFNTYTGLSMHQVDSTVKSNLNLGTGFNIQAGYLLKSNWGLGVRYSQLNCDINSASFANYNRNYSFIVTKYLAGNDLKIQAQFDYFQVRKSLQSSNNTANCNVQLMFCVNL